MRRRRPTWRMLKWITLGAAGLSAGLLVLNVWVFWIAGVDVLNGFVVLGDGCVSFTRSAEHFRTLQGVAVSASEYVANLAKWVPLEAGPVAEWRLVPAVLRDGARLTVTVPLWIPVVVLGLAALVFWRYDRAPAPGHCQKCGYDLTGNVSGTCPECGTPCPADAQTATRG